MGSACATSVHTPLAEACRPLPLVPQIQRRIRDFEKLYDLVKNQRNKFVNLIQVGGASACATMIDPLPKLHGAVRVQSMQSSCMMQSIQLALPPHPSGAPGCMAWSTSLLFPSSHQSVSCAASGCLGLHTLSGLVACQPDVRPLSSPKTFLLPFSLP